MFVQAHSAPVLEEGDRLERIDELTKAWWAEMSSDRGRQGDEQRTYLHSLPVGEPKDRLRKGTVKPKEWSACLIVRESDANVQWDQREGCTYAQRVRKTKSLSSNHRPGLGASLEIINALVLSQEGNAIHGCRDMVVRWTFKQKNGNKLEEVR